MSSTTNTTAALHHYNSQLLLMVVFVAASVVLDCQKSIRSETEGVSRCPLYWKDTHLKDKCTIVHAFRVKKCEIILRLQCGCLQRGEV